MIGIFEVSRVINGDTFVVKPRWKWDGYPGDHVRAVGYNAPELSASGRRRGVAFIYWNNLESLILGEKITITEALKLDGDCLVCRVTFNGRDLATYFTELEDLTSVA